MIFSKKMAKSNEISHCFFTKKNGASKGLYQSLNCGTGSKDDYKNIKKNLKIVSKIIGCTSSKLITMKQTHSNKVIFFKKNITNKKKLICDAILTDRKKICISVLTADCVPILLYEPKKKIIGVIHAGWRGAFNGIIQNVIKKLGNNKKKIIVSIGPCIAQKNYEVDPFFYNKFLNQNNLNKKFFKKKNKKYLFNLRAYVNFQFKKNGINNISNINRDTYQDNKSFFSYRRSLFKKESDYGRNISVIMIK